MVPIFLGTNAPMQMKSLAITVLNAHVHLLRSFFLYNNNNDYTQVK